MPISVDSIFTSAAQASASDVHIAVGAPIMFRITGELKPINDVNITSTAAKEIIQAVLGKQFERFTKEREIDVSYMVKKSGLRLRVNCHYERGNPGLVARIIPEKLPTMEEAALPEIAEQFCFHNEGLILFTGPTGAGKSTSMAAMIRNIQLNRNAHVVTLEDPIEFLFPQDGKGIVRQRQFGDDFTSFGEALRRVLRQDPNVVMVGEMRDLETISAALTLAETGHLVFGTLHTPNAMQTIDRIVDVFPPHQQTQVRTQLSLSLKAVFAQRLLPKQGGGLVALREVLINTPAVANIIRESRTQELVSTLQMGAEEGMITFEADAKRLYKEMIIDEDAYKNAMGFIEATIEGNKR